MSDSTDELRSLWETVSDVRERVRRLEAEREPVTTAINSHDDRLDEHDEQLASVASAVSRLSGRVAGIQDTISKHSDADALWHQGISKQVEDTNSLLRRLIETEGRVTTRVEVVGGE